MPSNALAAIVLAAGKGTRMKSELPKGLFPICGQPMAKLVGETLKSAGAERVVVVVGHGGDLMIEALGDGFEYVWQREQNGTGHAALMAESALGTFEGPVVICAADTPLLDEATLRALVEEHREAHADLTMATAHLPDPSGYGRVVRDVHNRATKIVEEKDANPKIKAIKEVNSGLYCVNASILFRLLSTLSNKNAQGEYYLTDIVEAVFESGGRVETRSFPPSILLGVNDRWQLAEAEESYRKQVIRRHCLNGVTVVDPNTTYISANAQIGAETVIFPMTHILGASVIGESCEIGPSTMIKDSTVGVGCTVLMSHMNRAKLGNDVRVGPYSNIRPGTSLGDGVKVGNFVEIKNAELGGRASVSHLTYIGDATIGSETNIGAGTITCNYDGYKKYRTTIGEGAFIGSNSTLIAPVAIGDGAIIAAGSVINEDVPADALGLGRARQEVKEEWAQKWRKRKQTD
ncbi:MAG: bifunctional UDP-N-acetylglucosamine diphosphorylase/glucosamine-1-phosphate N-acetyltransferase GlmU [Fimbriimonadaceae bacterium]|nr:bifunctional UDP-N-acetylglucosamine diphosphorylase/glucosamine-1-phosphate N-acetyltransferase GlmU [Fimbriimonadaceae bacterium]